MHLTYFGQTPGFGTGSPIIIFRHLKKLVEEGWQIDAFVERGQDTAACNDIGIRTHTLPLRRKWWPPYNPQSKFSRAARQILLTREARKMLDRQPSVCLSYLSIHSHDMAELAATFAERNKLPLLTIVHDDTTAFDFPNQDKSEIIKAHTKILKKSARNLFVSKELANSFELPASKKQILIPIPEGYRPKLVAGRASGPLRLFYAGRLWPNQLPLFEAISKKLGSLNAELHIIATSSGELTQFCQANNIRYHSPFPTNLEALDFLAENADALLVAYSLKMEDMEWIRTSFPSKLVEYSHIGLPIKVIAPEKSSVAAWLANKAPELLCPPDELATLVQFTESLSDPIARERISDTVRELATSHFSPDEIHKQFKSFIADAVASG